MINSNEQNKHSKAVSAEYTARIIELHRARLDEIFRNGVHDPTQIPYVYKLLNEYYALTGQEYKLNKENSIV